MEMIRARHQSIDRSAKQLKNQEEDEVTSFTTLTAICARHISTTSDAGQNPHSSISAGKMAFVFLLGIQTIQRKLS